MKKYFPDSISITEAVELQTQLSEDILLDDSLTADPKTIGGVAIYSRGDTVTVGLSVLAAEKMIVQETKVINERVKFPALPGCEGFRAGKVVADAIDNFYKADIFIINGHGINHPRRFGIASHVGLALDIPTIGASLQLMCGKVVEEDEGKYIYDKGEKVGKIVRKGLGDPDVFVSPGHKVSIESAAMIVEKMIVSKIPEPIRVAQKELLAEMKKKIRPI